MEIKEDNFSIWISQIPNNYMSIVTWDINFYLLLIFLGRLFDSNNLTGSIPSTLGLVQTLQMV